MRFLRAIGSWLHALAAVLSYRGEEFDLGDVLAGRVNEGRRTPPDALTAEVCAAIDGDDMAMVRAVEADDFEIWESECRALQRLAAKLPRRADW